MAGPVVETTSRILGRFGPTLLGSEYWEANPAKGSKPGYLPRLGSAAGPHKSGDDPHIAGRALDIVLFASRPNEKSLADALVQVLLKLKDKLKFISVVYNGSEWNGAGQKFAHPGHVTHIHIEWGAASMSHTGFEADLEAECKALKPADDTDYEID